MAQTSNAGVAAGQIRRGRLLAPTLVFLFAFGCFARALANEFVQWDNEKLLLNNIAYRGLGWPQLKYAFTTFFMGPYQPLSWISYSIDWTLWGLNPRGFHLTNLLLHAAASTCFYFLSRRLIELASTGVPPASVQAGAVVAALVFAVHPLRVESVVWAAERRDVLSGLLYVLTLLAYLRYATTDPARRGRWYGAMFLLYGLCLLAKGMAMTLPVVLLILDAYPLRRLTARRVWIEKIPFAALAVLAGALAIVGQRERAYLEGVATFGPLQRVATAGYATCFYLWKTAAPGGLMAMYERPPRLNPFAAQYAACAVLVVLVTTAVIAMRRRQPGLCAAWLYYLVTLAPVSGLVQSGWQIAADRYTYIPMMGFAVWAGGGVAVLLERRSRAGGFLSIGIGLVLAFWGGLTIRQIGFWHDSNRMWKRVLAVDPANAVAWSNLAIRAYLEGDLPTALANEEKAVTFRPDAAMFWQNYGAFLELSGRMEEALKAHRRGAEVAPNSVDILAEYAATLARADRFEDAEATYRRALTIDPNSPKALVGLGGLVARRGDLVTAETCLSRGVDSSQARPDEFTAAANVWFAADRPERAIETLRAGLRRVPASDAIALRLAWVLATHPRADYRNGLQAIELAQPLALRSGPRQIEAMTTLAAALAETGDFHRARQALAQAIQWQTTERATVDPDPAALRADIEAGRPIRREP